MAKLNFKKNQPLPFSEKTTPTPSQPSTPRAGEPDEEMELTLSSEEDISASLEAQIGEDYRDTEQEISADIAKKPTKKIAYQSDEGTAEYEGGFDSYSGGSSSKGVIIVILVIIFLVGGTFVLYKFTSLLENLPFFGKKPSPTVTTTPVAEQTTPPTPETASPLPAIMMRNLGNNQFFHTRFSKLLSSKSAMGRYSLIVMTPSEVNLTVISDSPEQAAGFKGELNKLFPDLNFRTIASQSKYLNNARLVFTDLSTKVTPALLQVSSGTPPTVSLTPDFQKEINLLTQKYKIRLEYFKAGKQIGTPTHQEHYFYMNLTGNKENMISLLQEISGISSLHINKLAVNPTNLITYSDKSLSARINISTIKLK